MIAASFSNARATLGKIPHGDPAWASFNDSFQKRDVTPQEFLRLVANGFAYTTELVSDGKTTARRRSENFVSGQHLALDLDDTQLSLEQVSRIPFFTRYANFAHTTPSHTEDNPRLRVVFLLDKPIRSRDKYTELCESLLSRFGATDQINKDPCRFYYSAMGCLTHTWGNILTLEDAAAELVFPFRKLKQQAKEAAERAAANRVIIPVNGVSPRLLEMHSHRLLERVRCAVPGEKHVTRRNVACTFGGYIASGYYQLGEVRSWLEAAVAANTTNLDAAMKTVDESLKFGMTRPLAFEQLVQQEPVRVVDDYAELHSVHPPLTREQKEAVVLIIKDREWRAFHEGMTAGQRAGWYAYGVDDGIIDILGLGVRPKSVDEETGEVHEQSFTIPFMRGDKLVNVEFRNQENIKYMSPSPSLWLPESGKDGSPTLVFPDTIRAIHGLLHFGHLFRVAGLPQMTMTPESLEEIENPVLVLEKGFNPLDYGLKFGRGKIRMVSLPFPLQQMTGWGMDAPRLQTMVNNARVWA